MDEEKKKRHDERAQIKKQRQATRRIDEKDYAAICGKIFCMSSFGHFNGFVRVIGHTDKKIRVCSVAHTKEIVSTNRDDILSTTTFTAQPDKEVQPYTDWLCNLEKVDLRPGVRYSLRQPGSTPSHGVMTMQFKQENKIF